MKRFLLVALTLLPVIATAAARVSPKDLAAIRAVLDAQAAAWNRGDIDAYMAGYAQSDDTMFVGTDVTRGWTKVRDRYKAKYDSRAKMGTLVFSDLDLRPAGIDDVVVTGAWKLTRDADTPHGRFTLIFHRRPEGWRIVYDHSS
ncbi:MAG: nuclear transport factor 2 family protein [Acidobacteria bacterium]|nr:nuclear transport factor 2 family protein [Acidobacteriota bacterium]MBV9067629.1 nuclear transport factor 2 family protein [Acidobacteriota bacterium]MBV9188237.1 nuclear transport factor 2 family protein [Acidobacteriota bacterium]